MLHPSLKFLYYDYIYIKLYYISPLFYFIVTPIYKSNKGEKWWCAIPSFLTDQTQPKSSSQTQIDGHRGKED